MATQLNLPYVRFIKQISTESGAITQFVSRMREGLDLLKAADWRLALTKASETALPVNYPVDWQLSDKYDAFKASTTASSSGTQTIHMGMAAYRFKIPAAAIAANNYVKTALVDIGADKFAYSGLKVSAILSASAVPPDDWDLLRSGGLSTTPDATGKFASLGTTVDGVEVYGVLNSHTFPNVVDAANQAGRITLDLSAAAANYAYLYIIVSMYDYTDYRANRPYWVEGSGLVNGISTLIEFNADATPDTSTAFDGWLYVTGNMHAYYSNPSYFIDENNFQIMNRKSSASTSYVTPEELMQSFPHAVTNISTSYTRFAGNTGGTVGINHSGAAPVYDDVYACVFTRFLGVTANQRYGKLKFAPTAGTFIDLSGKSMNLRMNVFEAMVDPATLGSPLINYRYLKLGTDGILQADFFRSSSAAGTAKFAIAPGAAETSVDLTFTRLASFKLEGGRIYTSADVWDIPLTTPGLRYLVFSVFLEEYSGTVGAATQATVKPGTVIYLK